MRWRPQFVLLSVTWGCSFWWVRVSLAWLSPIGVAFSRLVLGAAVLTVASVVSGAPPVRATQPLRHVAVIALLLNALPFSLFAFGQRSVSSVTAGVVNATTPLLALVFGYLVLPEERPTRRQITGLLVGFLGVMAVLGVWRAAPAGTWTGTLLCVLAVCCYGVAFPYARRHVSSLGIRPLSLATAQVTIGAMMLAPAVALSGLRNDAAITPDAGQVGAIVVLGCLGSGLAYVLNFSIIERAGATTASAVTYITPAVAITVGVAFLDETLHWNQVVGAAVIIAGVTMTRRARTPRERHGVREPTAPGNSRAERRTVR